MNEYPCIDCGSNVRPRQEALQCDQCSQWKHRLCNTGKTFLSNCIVFVYYLGTGYDYPDLPGLGNNNEKLGLPERLSTGIPVQEPISRKKNRVIVILFVRITWSYYYPEQLY